MLSTGIARHNYYPPQTHPHMLTCAFTDTPMCTVTRTHAGAYCNYRSDTLVCMHTLPTQPVHTHTHTHASTHTCASTGTASLTAHAHTHVYILLHMLLTQPHTHMCVDAQKKDFQTTHTTCRSITTGLVTSHSSRFGCKQIEGSERGRLLTLPLLIHMAEDTGMKGKERAEGCCCCCCLHVCVQNNWSVCLSLRALLQDVLAYRTPSRGQPGYPLPYTLHKPNTGHIQAQPCGQSAHAVRSLPTCMAPTVNPHTHTHTHRRTRECIGKGSKDTAGTAQCTTQLINHHATALRADETPAGLHARLLLCTTCM